MQEPFLSQEEVDRILSGVYSPSVARYAIRKTILIRGEKWTQLEIEEEILYWLKSTDGNDYVVMSDSLNQGIVVLVTDVLLIQIKLKY
jgi:hypothetical protein